MVPRPCNDSQRDLVGKLAVHRPNVSDRMQRNSRYSQSLLSDFLDTSWRSPHDLLISQGV
jgi:hypothetical protein